LMPRVGTPSIKRFKTVQQLEDYCQKNGLIKCREAAKILGLRYYTFLKSSSRHDVPPTEEVKFMGPATTKLFKRSEIELLRDARRVAAADGGSVLSAGDYFRLFGRFSPGVVKAFKDLDELLSGSPAREGMVRDELYLVEDLYENTETKLQSEVLSRVAKYLTDKVKGTEAEDAVD